MTEYLVTWRIELSANSPEDAARQAREIQLDPDSTALVYRVSGPRGEQYAIDLGEAQWAG
jgi:hypothetical protein